MAQAQWSALSSGYAVTTDWHGKNAPLGQSVIAWAGTTDSTIDGVEFRWLDPSGDIALTPQRKPIVGSFVTPDYPLGATQEMIDWGNSNPGVSVYYATDTQILNMLGDWAVQTNFYEENPVQTLRGKNSDIVRIRATSINVVPEVPFGTMAILLSMLGALVAFGAKRKHDLLTQAAS